MCEKKEQESFLKDIWKKFSILFDLTMYLMQNALALDSITFFYKKKRKHNTIKVTAWPHIR